MATTTDQARSAGFRVRRRGGEFGGEVARGSSVSWSSHSRRTRPARSSARPGPRGRRYGALPGDLELLGGGHDDRLRRGAASGDVGILGVSFGSFIER